MFRWWASTALLLLPVVAEAARFPVHWTNPTTYTDGSPLTDLASIQVEWGTCSGTAFGQSRGAVTVPTTVPGLTMSTFIEPQGLSKVCIRAFAVTAAGEKSAPSNVAVKTVAPTPGKPVTLGQPIILRFRN